MSALGVKSDNPLVELLERNEQLWVGKKVVLAGEDLSLQLLRTLVKAKEATLLCDNFELMQGAAAALGQLVGRSSFELAQAKHVKVIFSAVSDERLQEELKKQEIECLILFLHKTKSLSQNLLFKLQSHCTKDTAILIGGSNAIGGKSADSLIKGAADVYKVDSARKCTLFLGHLEPENASDEHSPLKQIKAPKALKDVEFGGMSLKQEQGVFSQGELDGGTKMLLAAMHRDLSGKEAGAAAAADAAALQSLTDLKALQLAPRDLSVPVLDLGCGSGIIALSLAQRGFKNIIASDISATALHCTNTNAQAQGLEGQVHTMACNMLPSVSDIEQANLQAVCADSKFQIIATNPPFHQGLTRTTSNTNDMIAKAKEHLTANGCLYLVGNNCLHYETALQEAFAKVEVLEKSTKFTVFKAAN